MTTDRIIAAHMDEIDDVSQSSTVQLAQDHFCINEGVCMCVCASQYSFKTHFRWDWGVCMGCQLYGCI
jgi:peroxiredoxin